ATLGAAEVEALIADGTIGQGMVPKVRSAAAALAGAEGVVIADGAARHALSRALADDDVGTRVVAATGTAATGAG
ncbi:MAG: acetylglutamate kinase, partial [Candidatus Limnocylindrales bacterium]